MVRILLTACLAFTLVSGASAQLPGVSPPQDALPSLDSLDLQALTDTLSVGEESGGRTTVLVEWSPMFLGVLPMIGFRVEPAAAPGFHTSFGASLIAHPMVLMAPTGLVEAGLAYSLPASSSVMLLARAGPSVFGSVAFGEGVYVQAGAHGGVGLLVGSSSRRLRLEYVARQWFSDGGGGRGPITHGVGIGVTWGCGR